MTKCIPSNSPFSNVKNHKVKVNFNGGEVSSDGGALLLSEIDRKLALTASLSKLFPDERDQSKVTHSIQSMLKQRIFGIALGYEDLNDHDLLRNCPALQTTVGQTSSLASSATLCRLENKANRNFIIEAHKVIIDQFIASYTTPPKELILDFDATDDLVHGDQEGKYFHGYYRNYCFLPLYVFCNKKLLISYLRTSKSDQAKHAWAILSLLVKRFRSVWPDVKIIFRGDSGFCRHKMLDWCDANKVQYIIGLAKNKVLNRLLEPTMNKTQKLYNKTLEKQKKFTKFEYAAETWKHKRKIIGKAEISSQGENPRYLVTNLKGSPQTLYENIYCARGEMENRIKEQQLDLFADRTSCSKWWPNQLRLMLSSFAYILVEYIRENLLYATELAKAQVHTIRLKIFKIGAVIIRNTRAIKFLLSSSYPYQDLWNKILGRMALL